MHAFIHSFMHTCVRTYARTCVHTYIYAFIHAYINIHANTYITHASIHDSIHTYIHTYIHTESMIPYIHTYMHAYVHTCIHTYMHTHIHTYVYISLGEVPHILAYVRADIHIPYVHMYTSLNVCLRPYHLSWFVVLLAELRLARFGSSQARPLTSNSAAIDTSRRRRTRSQRVQAPKYMDSRTILGMDRVLCRDCILGATKVLHRIHVLCAYQKHWL